MGFFKSLLKIIAIILVIIAIIFLIYAALVAIAGGAIAGSGVILGATLGGSAWAFLAVGVGLLAIASIISPEGFSEAMDRVGKGGAAVGGAIGDVVGGVIGGVMKGVGLPTLALAVGAFIILRRNKAKKKADSNALSDDSRSNIPNGSDLRVQSALDAKAPARSKYPQVFGPQASYTSRNFT